MKTFWFICKQTNKKADCSVLVHVRFKAILRYIFFVITPTMVWSKMVQLTPFSTTLFLNASFLSYCALKPDVFPAFTSSIVKLFHFCSSLWENQFLLSLSLSTLCTASLSEILPWMCYGASYNKIAKNMVLNITLSY